MAHVLAMCACDDAFGGRGVSRCPSSCQATLHPTAFHSLEDWFKCAPTGEALISNLCHVAVVSDRQLSHFGNNFV